MVEHYLPNISINLGIMLRYLSLFTFILSVQISFAQRAFEHSDSLNNKRFIGVTTGIATVWAGSMIGLSQVWYKDIPKSKFHTFDDSKNWLQMDKAGHYYASYKINKLTTEMLRWSGFDDEKSVWIGAGISLGYQTTFELLDGYSEDWGFSWSDIAANTLGSMSYLGQQLAWNEERIIPKFSFAPTEFSSERPEILGSNFNESLLKDYNGQTYWLSFSPGTFFKNSGIPKWACISVGYSAHEKLVGENSYYLSPISGKEYFEKREFLLSLDIDFSRLPIKRRWLKVIVSQLNYLKIPFPALLIRGDQLVGSWTGY